MKNFRNKRIASVTGLLVLALLFLVPHEARANVIADAFLFIPGLLIGKIVMPVMGFFVWSSAMILNWSLEYSVVNMAKHIAEAGIDDTWRVVRDLANMGFIFVLIYTALQTMFGFGNYKETVKNIVIAALLINFSLLITKAIIDASNVLALFFYNAITVGATDPTTHGLSAAFMDKLGIAKLYSTTGSFSGAQLTTIGIAGSIIYLITAFSFLAVAAMFIIRFIALIFVLVLSPVMFVAEALPNMKGRTKMWRDTLTGQALFGPIYFAMTWITLKVAQGLFPSGGIGSGAFAGKVTASGAIQADPTTAATIINFIILIGLMVASISIAKSTATKGASLIGTAINYATGKAGGATLGMAGRMGRGTVGRAGAAVANSEKVKNMIERGGAAGMAGRLALAGGKKAATSSFDARGIGGLGKALGAGSVAKNASFEQDVKDRTKAATDTAKFLKPSDNVLKDARAAEDKTDTELSAHLESLGYKKSDTLKKAEEDLEKAKEDKGKNADKKKKEATQALDAARKAESAEREKFLKDDRAKQLYNASQAAQKTREHMENRAESFIKKEGEPTISVPQALREKLKAQMPRTGAAVEAVSTKGIGGATASYVERKAEAIRAKAQQSENRGLAWLGTKVANNMQIGAEALKLRQNERDARVAAIRKATKEKSKKDKAADLFQEMVDEAKEDEKKPADAGGSTPPTSGGSPERKSEGGGSTRAPME